MSNAKKLDVFLRKNLKKCLKNLFGIKIEIICGNQREFYAVVDGALWDGVLSVDVSEKALVDGVPF